MYTILTTYPRHTSGNVGDRLITQSAIEILRREKDESDFEVFFREESLDEVLSVINHSRAILMPGFAIRDPMYPQVYRLTDSLGELKVPLIPMGAGTKFFPGDHKSLSRTTYSNDTVDFLKFVAEQSEVFSCREYVTCQVLRKHGIENVAMVGDCAWYDLSNLGSDMRRPEEVRKLVFTTPHRPEYTRQAKLIIDMLSALFPGAKKYCSLQSLVGQGNRHESTIAQYSASKGFEVKDASHELEGIAYYKDCDLHVGYRCHGHIAFLRKRIPSILIHEDSRGVGFSQTLGTGGFDGFSRPSGVRESANEVLLSAWEKARSAGGARSSAAVVGTFTDPTVMVDMGVVEAIGCFLRDELESGFRRYLGVPKILDETYACQMKSFLDQIP